MKAASVPRRDDARGLVGNRVVSGRVRVPVIALHVHAAEGVNRQEDRTTVGRRWHLDAPGRVPAKARRIEPHLPRGVAEEDPEISLAPPNERLVFLENVQGIEPGRLWPVVVSEHVREWHELKERVAHQVRAAQRDFSQQEKNERCGETSG